MRAGIILLHNLPKTEIRLDLRNYPIRRGFRGFREVPAGLHRLTLKIDEYRCGFWCFSEEGRLLVMVFDRRLGKFVEAGDRVFAHYQSLAQSDRLARHTLPYSHKMADHWRALSCFIDVAHFPPPLMLMPPQEDLLDEEGPLALATDPRLRFREVLVDQHDGDWKSLLEEFQFAFLSGYVSGEEEPEAVERWTQLARILFSAGVDAMKRCPKLFLHLPDILTAQLSILPITHLSSDRYMALDFAEDLIDTRHRALAGKGRDLLDFLETQGLV